MFGDSTVSRLCCHACLYNRDVHQLLVTSTFACVQYASKWVLLTQCRIVFAHPSCLLLAVGPAIWANTNGHSRNTEVAQLKEGLCEKPGECQEHSKHDKSPKRNIQSKKTSNNEMIVVISKKSLVFSTCSIPRPGEIDLNNQGIKHIKNTIDLQRKQPNLNFHFSFSCMERNVSTKYHV